MICKIIEMELRASGCLEPHFHFLSYVGHKLSNNNTGLIRNYAMGGFLSVGFHGQFFIQFVETCESSLYPTPVRYLILPFWARPGLL